MCSTMSLENQWSQLDCFNKHGVYKEKCATELPNFFWPDPQLQKLRASQAMNEAWKPIRVFSSKTPPPDGQPTNEPYPKASTITSR